LLAASTGETGRVIGGFEAAQRPAQILLPLKPESERAESLVQGLADESVRAVSAPGDLGQALEVSKELNPSARNALVVAGPDATAMQPPPPGVVVDVIGVGIAKDSAQDAALRRLAAATGGRYANVEADAVQAQAAYFDALRRCERPLDRFHIEGHEKKPNDIGSLATPVSAGGDFEAYAFSPADTNWIDVTFSWTDPGGVEVEAYQIWTVKADENPPDDPTYAKAPEKTMFDENDLADALAGQDVCRNGIRLTGSKGDTFATFRLDFGGEDDTLRARTSRHWSRYAYGHGGVDSLQAHASQGGADVYPQFFAPDPARGDAQSNMEPCPPTQQAVTTAAPRGRAADPRRG
jgi:hypothetical protein